MTTGLLSTGALEKILDKTLSALEAGRSQIYEMAETARQECKRIEQTLQAVQAEMHQAIIEVETLGRQFAEVRGRLYTVSKNFEDYTEEEKRLVYEAANRVREQLALAREKEHNLRVRRDNLEQSFVKVKEIVDKAERLVSQVGVALNYLSGNIEHMSEEIENIQTREQIGQEILKGQEHERKRMAGALHDGPVQDLANLIVQMEICERLYETKRVEEACNNFGVLKDIVQGSIKEMRRIIYDLNPMTLEDLGLVPTLKNMLQNISETTDIKTHLSVLGQETRLDPQIEVVLFRTIQEAANNSRKHGRPSHLEVTIEFLARQVSVEIKDNGCGFDLRAVRNKLRSGTHFGLVSMENRVKILNGNLRITTGRDKGTKILVTIPLQSDLERGGGK